MAERSQEIEQALRESVQAIASSDLDAIARSTSREDGVLSIGSDAGEWAEGYDEIMQLFRDSMPDGELGVTASIDDVKGYSEGTVGWAASRGHFELEGHRVPVRLTAVLHREGGGWKIVQAHASIGVPNDRMTDPMFQGG